MTDVDEGFVRPFDERGVTVGGDFEVAEPELHHDESYLGLVSLRTTLLILAGEPAPLPAEHAPRLAGFSWFDSESVRVYVTAPAESAVLGVDLDLPAGTEVGPRGRYRRDSRPDAAARRRRPGGVAVPRAPRPRRVLRPAVRPASRHHGADALVVISPRCA
ncbi:hypothetical protein [Actinopolyspora saharensis]|uniref:hypothetical protein n=1 Tax=Actinopolyspora saharensis TaxID=995062 RepID=UPI003F672633